MAKETDPESQDIADLRKKTTHPPKSLKANLDKGLGSSELLESSQGPQLAPDTQVQIEPPAFSVDTANHESLDRERLDSKTVSQKGADDASRVAPKFPNALPKLAGLAAAILLGGGIITALNLSQRSPQSPSPAGSQLVPQDALATLSVSTDEGIWTRLRQFGTAKSQTQFDQLLTDWKDRLFTLNGYRFKQDIEPWIGDRVTLALLPAAEKSTDQPTSQPQVEGIAAATQNIVLIAPVTDLDKANALLESGPQRSAITWEDRSYKKVPIKTIRTETGQAMEAAVVGADWLLLSNTASGIEQAIDTYRGKRSLQDNAGYRNAIAALEDPRHLGNRFAQIYLNIPIATELLKAPAGASASQSGSLVPLQGSQGVVATALVESEGLRFKGTSWLLPENDLAYEDLNNTADDMLRRLPSDTLLALSGSSLQQTWRALSEGNISPPFFPDARNLRAALLTQTGLDIETDIMPWASGEFALGLLPPASQPTEENAPDQNQVEKSAANQSGTDTSEIATSSLALMVQTNDRAAAESVWAQIDDVMVNRYRYRVETTDLPEGSVTRWFSPFRGVQFSHGWLSGNVAFFTVGSDAAETIIPAPSSSLVGTNLFQTLTGSAPKPNNGQFFLDLAKINDTDGVFPLPQLSQELSAAGPTSAIQAIGLTSTVGDRTMDYDLYIKLSKAARPGPI